MISKIRIKNFKAIKDSGEITLSPFTAIIGRNGSGKSSLIEAIEFLHDLVEKDLEDALQKWKKYDDILFKGEKEIFSIDISNLPDDFPPARFIREDTLTDIEENELEDPSKYVLEEGEIPKGSLHGIEFIIEHDFQRDPYLGIAKNIYHLFITKYINDKIIIPFEQIINCEDNSYVFMRRKETIFSKIAEDNPIFRELSYYKSIFSYKKLFVTFDIEKFQFLNINSFLLGNPVIKPFSRDEKVLSKDGSNLLNILHWLSEDNKHSEKFRDLKFDFLKIINYATDLRGKVTSDVENLIHILLSEKTFDDNIPSWLMSTGSLKILALLSIIHNPNPAPVIIIEEFENGLDPWTIDFLIKKFKEFIQQTGSQVIITTHSATLLNLLEYTEILFAKRNSEKGYLEYVRFEEEKEMLNDVQENILAGELYEKIRQEEFERNSLREEMEKIKKDFKANIKCLVITEDSANIDIPHKMPIYMILKASGFNMEETLIQSYKSKDKIMLGYGIAQSAESYSNINKIIFHRDKDGEFAKKDKEFKSYKEYHGLNKTELFVTNGNDIESYFINKDHIKYLYNDLNEADIVYAIESSIADLKDTSIKKLISNLNDNADAANLLYESDPLLYTYTKIIGKKIHPKLAKFIKGDHSIFKESSYLKDERLEKIAKEIWG